MNDEVFEYKNAEQNIYNILRTIHLGSIDKDGFYCILNSLINGQTFNGSYRYFFNWCLDWGDLKNQGVERISGYILIKGSANSPSFGEHKIDIDEKRPGRNFSKEIYCNASEVSVTFEYRLIPHYAEKNKLRNFDNEEAKEDSDVTLVVKDQKFHVLKKYLSTHSTYFKSLFFGKFSESGKPEIELKDIDPDDFQHFLDLIYGETDVKADSVLGILHLADFFDFKTVIRRCQEFLMEPSKLPLNRRFKTAIKYNMEKLKLKCISDMNSAADLQSIVPENSNDFDSDIWKELFIKSLSMIPK